MDRKQEIREELKGKLSRLSDAAYRNLSERVALHLFSDKSWLKAKTIGITVSRKPEVDTWPIIRKAWEEGKRVAVPKCIPRQRLMTFRELTGFNQLESVYYGLLEPIEADTAEVKHDDIDLLVVPGLGFTAAGHRIGFGGGYYDRFLQDYNGRTLSLAFEIQMMDALPLESHDRPVDRLITEEGQVKM